jgi:hypothetical protein
MASDVEICSVALMSLGDDPINSLADETRAATLCANLYPPARLEVMRAHPWNCCVTRVILAPLSAAPAYGYGKQFTKPSDWLRTLDVGENGNQDFRFEKGRFLADTDALYLRYIADVSEGNWDALLVHVMTKRMRYALAYPITKSTSLEAEAKADYEAALKQAKSVDGQENPPEEIGDSPFIDCRGG